MIGNYCKTLIGWLWLILINQPPPLTSTLPPIATPMLLSFHSCQKLSISRTKLFSVRDQVVRKVSFSENFANVLHKWSLNFNPSLWGTRRAGFELCWILANNTSCTKLKNMLQLPLMTLIRSKISFLCSTQPVFSLDLVHC